MVWFLLVWSTTSFLMFYIIYVEIVQIFTSTKHYKASDKYEIRFTTGTHSTTLSWLIYRYIYMREGTHHSNSFKTGSGQYQLEGSQPPPFHPGQGRGRPPPWRCNCWCSHLSWLSHSRWQNLFRSAGKWSPKPDKWNLSIEDSVNDWWNSATCVLVPGKKSMVTL